MRFIRIEEVKEKTGLSRSSIYSFIKQGRFPKQIQLEGRMVCWLESDIDEWLGFERGKFGYVDRVFHKVG
ncbi:AlpA family transcriptional regulator [Vibrio hannami]|uniref:AlpA family transcriptional regulator n=1 Tax=Vibrio hannami TaxID=2717094 RepID=UPI00240FF6D8|nr:AlpA family transcriptional regulator [Vibrio hannami]MDG3085528.1 AlpA family transcriptional regulator [Vibrio hannami]